MRITFFTGAGISKESGIPTFRGEDGKWNSFDPNEVAHKNAWRYGDRSKIIRFHNELRRLVASSEPNAAHLDIAKAHSAGHDVWVVTQNIDDLHERSGLPVDRILHLHGEIMAAHDGIRKYRIEGDMPVPEKRGMSHRPHVVWFGESPENMDVADDLVRSSDVVVVVGSTLEVWPAAGLVIDSAEHKRKIVVDPNMPEDLAACQHVEHVAEAASTGVREALGMIGINID
jgi:NAD-dependent deacetylase